MRRALMSLTAVTTLVSGFACADFDSNRDRDSRWNDNHQGADLTPSVQLGPRPFFLVNDMSDSKLKRE